MYAIKILNTIDAFEETIAFETLWALEGMAESKIAALFKEFQGGLPSEVLNKVYTTATSSDAKDQIPQLQSRIEDYIKETKLGLFSVCVNGDFQYPPALRKAKHPIELFYYRGNLDLLNVSGTKLISVVGAREASEEGVARATRLAKELGEAGYTIVSGLAKGIDTTALTSAIKHGYKTIAVIGTPLDEVYPKENRELQEVIATDHLLISHVPFYQYKQESFQAHKYHFPRRNATMAAISEGTVIVEASESSGTLTQARACIQQGRPLFILDSCFHNPNITWPDRYLTLGAIRVKTTDDIVRNLSSSSSSQSSSLFSVE